jgi:hypothetical protein
LLLSFLQFDFGPSGEDLNTSNTVIAAQSEEQATSAKLSDEINKIVRRDHEGDSGNLVREINKIDQFKRLLIENPFGIGLADTGRSGGFNSTNAVIFWTISTGIVGILAMIYIFIYLFNNLIFNIINKNNYVIIGCLIGLTLANLSYGNFIGPFYLIILAIYVHVGVDNHINRS